MGTRFRAPDTYNPAERGPATHNPSAFDPIPRDLAINPSPSTSEYIQAPLRTPGSAERRLAYRMLPPGHALATKPLLREKGHTQNVAAATPPCSAAPLAWRAAENCRFRGEQPRHPKKAPIEAGTLIVSTVYHPVATNADQDALFSPQPGNKGNTSLDRAYFSPTV